MDYDALIKNATFNMENRLYGSMIAKALEVGNVDVDDYMQFQSIVAAFNKRGVSTRILFEVIMEVFGKVGDSDE